MATDLLKSLFYFIFNMIFDSALASLETIGAGHPEACYSNVSATALLMNPLTVSPVACICFLIFKFSKGKDID